MNLLGGVFFNMLSPTQNIHGVNSIGLVRTHERLDKINLNNDSIYQAIQYTDENGKPIINETELLEYGSLNGVDFSKDHQDQKTNDRFMMGDMFLEMHEYIKDKID
ncbi:hypothetical protein Zmor_016306 [Zophobas morio]|uniref:Uncharacterized protein n=1 Tax=Zophobas morio TaxID=2755281 RepID=A0AA38HHS0_9CUCU|nr:hypothetical protein Zmor_016306 [Zophobas morio]